VSKPRVLTAEEVKVLRKHLTKVHRTKHGALSAVDTGQLHAQLHGHSGKTSDGEIVIRLIHE
jgi:hypothetical protein